MVSRRQLRELGFTPIQIAWRIEHGRLHRVHHNVYAVGHRALISHGHLIAALLSAGPTAFLSHRTAAAVWGLRPVNMNAIELTIPGQSRRAAPPLIIHRTRHAPHPHDLRTRTDLRVAALPLVLIQLAARETAEELTRLVEESVGRRLLRLDTPSGGREMEAALERHPRHPGMTQLTQVLRAYRAPPRHRSRLERAFDRLLAAHPEIPAPQRNVHIGRYEIDRFWPEHRLAVELDGRPYHVAARAMKRDRRKDSFLQRLGIRVVRFTDEEVEDDPDALLAEVYEILGIKPEQ